VNVCACGGKALISRLILLSPPPAAPYGLAPVAFVVSFRICPADAKTFDIILKRE